MKKLVCLSLILALFSTSAQPIDRTFENGKGDINLLGITTIERLKQEPFGEWFEESYNEYEVDVEELKDVQLPDSIVIFMGTWCGDSRREVPRFIKILESQNYDFSKLTIINVNTGFQNYKQAPEREERGQYIHRVPTFIFYGSDKKEIGRIVQDPVVSLEADIRSILNGEDYQTYFPVANDLIDKFRSTSLEDIRKKLPKLAEEYKEKTVSESELRTFGYVMWSSFDLARAEVIFELNALVYPDSVDSYGQLVSFKSSYGKEKEAISYLKKGLKLEPENERLLAWKSRFGLK